MNKYFPADYSHAVRASVLIALVYQATGYLVTRARHTYFSDSFMNKHFGEEHQKYFKEGPATGGYPDAGDGRYADKLSFGDWHKFNLAVRAYGNFSEWILISILSTLLAGLYFPLWASYVGYVLALGRVLYAVGYLVSPGKRMVGAATAEIAAFVNIILIGYGVYSTK